MIAFDIKKQLNGPFGKMLLEITASIPAGQLVALYGKSGAGKTSLLRILAGLMRPDQGQIAIDGTIWLDTNKGVYLSPQKRQVGFLFQDYALFPNMTVRENLRFALQKNQDPAIVSDLIELIELGGLKDRKPATLSGGQQQRVALARALVQRPQLLLLDEPLSALDPEMRAKLQDHLLAVHREYGLTMMLVSHDRKEVQRLADEVWVMEAGRVIRQGAPAVVFPESETDLVGVVTGKEVVGGVCKVVVDIGGQRVVVVVDRDRFEGLGVGQRVTGFLRVDFGNNG